MVTGSGEQTTDPEWKGIPSAPGYEASTTGEIRSTGFTQANPLTGGSSFRPGRVLKGSVASTGYRMYYLGTASGSKRKSGHRLVCEAFHGPAPEGKPLVRHLDGDPLNNRPENLRWGTHSENERDKNRHGRNTQRNKTHCPQGHVYDKDNTHVGPGGWRLCRACSRERNAERARRGLPDGDPRHGTAYGYLSFRCRCEPCKEAYREYTRRRKTRLDSAA